MSNKVWREMWKRNDIAFHQFDVNPLLKRFLPQLGFSKSSRILVPLCGKSLDLGFLAESGYHVTGIELSPIAIKDYFEALEVKPHKERIGKFTRWKHRNTEIWCGDIFDLSSKDINQNAVLYDCTSLTAFSSTQRPDYIKHFYKRLPENSQIILVTAESTDENDINSALLVDSEVSSLYQQHYEVELIHGQTRLQQDPSHPLAAHTEMDEKIYLMKRR